MTPMERAGFAVGDTVEITRNNELGFYGAGERFEIIRDDKDHAPKCARSENKHCTVYVELSHMKKVADDKLWFIAVVTENPVNNVYSAGTTENEYGMGCRVIKGRDNARRIAEQMAVIYAPNKIKIGQFSETCKHSNIVWEKE